MTESIDEVCRRVAKTRPDTLKACNFYVQAVFRELYGKDMSMVGGTANEIVNRLSAQPFTSLGSDAMKAAQYAGQGKIVLGGVATATGSGHIFVVQSSGLSKAGQPTPWVVDGKPAQSRGNAPKIFHGSKNPKIPTPESSVDIVFSRSDQARIQYAWVADPRKAK